MNIYFSNWIKHLRSRWGFSNSFGMKILEHWRPTKKLTKEDPKKLQKPVIKWFVIKQAEQREDNIRKIDENVRCDVTINSALNCLILGFCDIAT